MTPIFTRIAAIAFLMPLIVAPANVYPAEFKVLHAFQGGRDGEFPLGGVVADRSGNLYGTACGDCQLNSPGKICSKRCGNTYGFVRGGQREKVIHTFDGKDGASPAASLLSHNLSLFGTTQAGGNNHCKDGCGTVFELARNGEETVLYDFCTAKSCADGSKPAASLIIDQAGNLFGTTELGGSNGLGTLFKLALTGDESVLYSFCSKSACADGAGPLSSLIESKSGDFYGTTDSGGNGYGTVFKVSAAGTETVVHAFSGQDGANPQSGLISDSAGNFYGTTAAGGAHNMGAVYKLTPDGTETVLYSFQGGLDGANPVAGLISDENGVFYGTTEFGGSGGIGFGTIYRLTKGGDETILHRFCLSYNSQTCADGQQPVAPLFLERAYLIGTAMAGGVANRYCFTIGCGVVFRTTK